METRPCSVDNQNPRPWESQAIMESYRKARVDLHQTGAAGSVSRPRGCPGPSGQGQQSLRCLSFSPQLK